MAKCSGTAFFHNRSPLYRPQRTLHGERQRGFCKEAVHNLRGVMDGRPSFTTTQLVRGSHSTRHRPVAKSERICVHGGPQHPAHAQVATRRSLPIRRTWDATLCAAHGSPGAIFTSPKRLRSPSTYPSASKANFSTCSITPISRCLRLWQESRPPQHTNRFRSHQPHHIATHRTPRRRSWEATNSPRMIALRMRLEF